MQFRIFDFIINKTVMNTNYAATKKNKKKYKRINHLREKNKIRENFEVKYILAPIQIQRNNVCLLFKFISEIVCI